MTQESGCPYEEVSIKFSSTRKSVLKRPGMYFGDLLDGSAYAGIIQDLVQATLSWRIGANLGIRLKPNNEVELYCYGELPKGEMPLEPRGCRPIHVLTKEQVLFGDRALEYAAVACSQMNWEIQDQFSSGSVNLQEGYCRSAMQSAQNLPAHLCLRVALKIGTSDIPIAPATLAQVAHYLRYMSGPAEAGYWGCVSIKDLRTNETLDRLVTDPPPGPCLLQSRGNSL